MPTLPEFVSQLISLAWLKCAMEEGVKFINIETGQVETNELILFQHFEHKTGKFVMPKANVSPQGMEKSLYEILGRFLVNNSNQDVQFMLRTPEFKSGILEAINKLHEKAKQPLRGSPIDVKHEHRGER